MLLLGRSAARLVTVAITAIWPNYKNLANILPASAGITSVNLASCKWFNPVQRLLRPR
jgi:hypothetical protein